MNKCIKCGSYAFNLYKDDIDQGGLCDVHYWQGRAHRAEALAEQPAQQEPVAVADGTFNHNCPVGTPLYTSPPAQRTWVGLSEEEIARVVSLAGFDPDWAEAHIAIQIVRTLEAKLKEKNT